MSKIEKLLDKTKRNGETKKWKMYLFAVVGILVVVGGFFGASYFVYWITDVNSYIHDTKEIPTLNEFYNEHYDSSQTKVLFLGDSQIGFSVYPKVINNILRDSGYDISVYNLFMTGANYKDYLFQVNQIIKTNPSLVVIGVSYNKLGDSEAKIEKLKLFYDQSDVADEWSRLLDSNEMDALNTNLRIWDYKEYFTNALKYKLGINTDSLFKLDYINDPLGDNIRESWSWIDGSEESLRRQISMYSYGHEYNPDENTNQKHALKYISDRLQSAGIPVVYVGVPIHPYHAELITDDVREEYHSYLNSTGYKWYDFENMCNEVPLFRDHAHVSLDGSLKMSPAYADLIIQELS